ncbi:hypothetical protein [Falsihalocynthiibacter arcticus]|nr:hypothetical protein [Falsihalocynthiibacter arcticus]
MAFADLLHADNVITFAPLTTASFDIIPREKRFEMRQNLGWPPPFNDALAGLKTPKKVWGIYDPDHPDGFHARRVKEALNERFQDIPVLGIGHGVPAKLLTAGVLKESFLHCLRENDPALLRSTLSTFDFSKVRVFPVPPPLPDMSLRARIRRKIMRNLPDGLFELLGRSPKIGH